MFVVQIISSMCHIQISFPQAKLIEKPDGVNKPQNQLNGDFQ